jgi:hypothetical protein
MYKTPANLSQDEERMFVSHLLSFHSSETPTEEPFEYLRQVIHEARNSTAAVSNIAGQLLQSK